MKWREEKGEKREMKGREEKGEKRGRRERKINTMIQLYSSI